MRRRSAAGLLLVATCGVAAGADIPGDRKVIDIDVIPGKLGAVRFLHAAHAKVGWRADHSPITCRDCHHELELDASASQGEERRCGACHPGVGEPDRVIGGRRARAMARLKPDGAIDYRTILFHAYCRDCHKKVEEGDLRLQQCKVCHKRGIGADASHGRYDAVREAGLAWLRCSVGQRWSGKRCEGEATPVTARQAARACPAGCRVPYLEELLGILGGCVPEAEAGGQGVCRSCRDSPVCSRLLGADAGTYWAAAPDGEPIWAVNLSDGSVEVPSGTAQGRARCVQPVP